MITKENLKKVKEYVDKVHELTKSIIETVVSAVCMITDVDIEIFYTRSLAHDICYAKRMVWYILRRHYDMMTKNISEIFGYSRARVRSGIADIDFKIKQYRNISIDYNQIMNILG